MALCDSWQGEVAVLASVAVVYCVSYGHSRVCTVCGFWNLSYPMGMPLVGSWRSAAGETKKADNSPLLHSHTHTYTQTRAVLAALSFFSLFPLNVIHFCILSLINYYCIFLDAIWYPCRGNNFACFASTVLRQTLISVFGGSQKLTTLYWSAIFFVCFFFLNEGYIRYLDPDLLFYCDQDTY